MGIDNFISFLGLFILVSIAWIFSTNRNQFNFRLLIWGISLQLIFAVFIFYFPPGVKFFSLLNKLVLSLLDSATAGAQFLFGSLAIPPGGKGLNGEASLGFFLAFQAFPTIVFFSTLMSILYFYNILPRIIKFFAHLFSKLMKISGAESFSVASNIFVGIESALTIKPHIGQMTKSELCTILTAMMATVSSNVLAIYVFYLIPTFPNIAGHLISASILSVPAALVISKILIPETERPVTMGANFEPYQEKAASIIEAIMAGAITGGKLIFVIATLLIAVLGLVHLADSVLNLLGHYINEAFSIHFDWSLKNILGFLFYPLILLLGLPLEDVLSVSRLVGERLIVTEVVSYQDLAQMIKSGTISNPRTIVITSYALCGFTHFASLAIFVGGLSALAPERTKTLVSIAMRSLLAATLTTLMTACIAGAVYSSHAKLITR